LESRPGPPPARAEVFPRVSSGPSPPARGAPNDVSEDIPAAARDPWLTPAGLIEAGAAWAGGDEPAQPRLSPVNGPVAGLPPTDIYIGGRDLFLPDVRRLSQRARTAGWPLNLIEEPGAVHVYPLVPAPEGRHARNRIVASLSA
jgi:epsilon-lactone hydrolase